MVAVVAKAAAVETRAAAKVAAEILVVPKAGLAAVVKAAVNPAAGQVPPVAHRVVVAATHRHQSSPF